MFTVLSDGLGSRFELFLPYGVDGGCGLSEFVMSGSGGVPVFIGSVRRWPDVSVSFSLLDRLGFGPVALLFDSAFSAPDVSVGGFGGGFIDGGEKCWVTPRALRVFVDDCVVAGSGVYEVVFDAFSLKDLFVGVGLGVDGRVFFEPREYGSSVRSFRKPNSNGLNYFSLEKQVAANVTPDKKEVSGEG